MKTKILIIALTTAMLSFGTLSHAQEMKPLSASNKTIVVEQSQKPDSQASVSSNQDPTVIATDQVAQIVKDAQLHLQITQQLQQFFENRQLDEQVCLDAPQTCEYEVSYAMPSIVY